MQSVAYCAGQIQNSRQQGGLLKPTEITKLEAYLQKTFQLPSIQVKARPQKDDSAEVYIGDEFIGIVFRDDEDDDLSYNFQMAILDFDLD